MDENEIKALSVFFPYILERKDYIDKNDIKFVQYTSADSAMNIIKNKEVWLRNSQCMNDSSEVEHGLSCLIDAFNSETEGKRFKEVLENIFPDIIEEFIEVFDSWLPSFRTNTFIACVSEHLNTESRYGRLSMWRAYGGDSSVALVLNKKPFMGETDVFNAYTNPVAYLDSEDFIQQFSELSNRIAAETEYVKSLGKKVVFSLLFEVFKNIAMCVKHPGFKEEREWRVTYNPILKKSEHVKTSIESINGIPQEVYKIPLENIPEHGFYGATVPEIIEKIIIGPNDHQIVLGHAFAKLLEEAGCDKPYDKISYSGIPLR